MQRQTLLAVPLVPVVWSILQVNVPRLRWLFWAFCPVHLTVLALWSGV